MSPSASATTAGRTIDRASLYRSELREWLRGRPAPRSESEHVEALLAFSLVFRSRHPEL